MSRKIEIDEFSFQIEGTLVPQECEVLKRAFRRFDRPTLQRFHGGATTDLGILPPLRITVLDAATMYERHSDDGPIQRRLFGRLGRRRVREMDGCFAAEQCLIFLRAGSWSECVAVHELCHASLHYDRHRVTRSLIYKGANRAICELDEFLDRHRERQAARLGIGRRDIRKYVRVWKKRMRDKPVRRSESVLENRVYTALFKGFVSPYAMAGSFEFPEQLESEEFLVENWTAYLFPEATGGHSRGHLKTCDPTMYRVIERFVELRVKNAAADEIVGALRPLLSAEA